MNSIDQNYLNNYDLNHKNIGFKSEAAAEQYPVQVPDLYYIPDYSKKPKTFKETVKQVDVMGLFYQWLEHPLLMLGTCAGLSIGIDAFDRSCNKEYSKSIVGKAAKLGDKIENLSVVQSSPVQKTLGGLGKGWNWVKKTALKSDVIRAFFTTPSRPENKTPKYEMQHTDFHVATQFKELARDLGLTNTEVDTGDMFKKGKLGGKPKQLSWKDWDLSKDEINYLKEKFGVTDLSKVSNETLSNRIKLKRLGLEESEISSILSKSDATAAVRDELLKKGGKDAAWLEKIMKSETLTKDEINEISKFCKNIEGQKMNKSWCKVPVLKRFFSNVRGTTSISNKLSSMSEGAETKTGKFMSKLLQKFHRGITFGGGKFMVLLFVGPTMLEAFLNTKKADRSEKVGTLMSGMIEPATWVFTFPLILRFMHGYGGIQYAGMSPDKIAEYRDRITKFNARVDAKEFKDNSAYKAAKKELKNELKELKSVKNESVLTTILRKISHFTKCDLEKIKPYNNGNAIMNFLRKIPNTLKNITFGYIGRFGLFMFAFMPLADKLIKKCLNLVFGKSYDSMKEEEFEAKKKEQEIFAVNDLSTRLEEAQRRKIYPELSQQTENIDQQNPFDAMLKKAQAEQKQNPVNNQPTADDMKREIAAAAAAAGTTAAISEENTKPAEQEIVKPTEQKTENQAQQTSTKKMVKQPEQKPVTNVKRDNYTYIPSQNSVFSNNLLAQTEKYIPAQTAQRFDKTFDNSRVAKILKHANRAEERAINILGGNFGDIG